MFFQRSDGSARAGQRVEINFVEIGPPAARKAVRLRIGNIATSKAAKKRAAT
jgi:hypothetical protein